MNKNRKNLIKEFVKRNSKINLSAIREDDEIYSKHILDSLELNKIIHRQSNSTCLDFGTGGGFPMLPLAISNPEISFFGIDSKRKKINAVNDIIQKLKIHNAKAIWTRLEEYKDKHETITVRAVGHIAKIFNLCQQKLKKDGQLVVYKQLNFEEDAYIREICDSQKFSLNQRHIYDLRDKNNKRIIYIIQKLK